MVEHRVVAGATDEGRDGAQRQVDERGERGGQADEARVAIKPQHQRPGARVDRRARVARRRH